MAAGYRRVYPASNCSVASQGERIGQQRPAGRRGLAQQYSVARYCTVIALLKIVALLPGGVSQTLGLHLRSGASHFVAQRRCPSIDRGTRIQAGRAPGAIQEFTRLALADGGAGAAIPGFVRLAIRGWLHFRGRGHAASVLPRRFSRRALHAGAIFADSAPQVGLDWLRFGLFAIAVGAGPPPQIRFRSLAVFLFACG